MKVKIGSALRHKVQQYDRRDPWPKVPFVTPDYPDSKGAIITYVVVAIGIVIGATFEYWKWW